MNDADQPTEYDKGQAGCGCGKSTFITPYLSPEDIAGMTKPLTQAAAQVKFLRKIDIRAERRPDGSVLVMREWLVVRMPTEPKPRPELQPLIEKRRAQTTQTR